MATLKLTKSELRVQQNRLLLLLKYLPTLQLKKALLQGEVSEAKTEIQAIEIQFADLKNSAEAFSSVMSDSLSFDLRLSAKVQKLNKRYENIAGVEVPYFDDVIFEPFDYNLIDTPAWVDTVIDQLKELVRSQARLQIAFEKKEALERELREVSIRVNLFEKVLIPRAENNIKKIKVFLGDQLLAAVSRAKVAKSKIEASKIPKG